jgi:hypothetical protein
MFFTVDPGDKTKVFGISFVSLWKSWKSGFDKRYDIPDADVAKELRNGGTLAALRVVSARSGLAAKDYDLDTHAGYKPPTTT